VYRRLLAREKSFKIYLFSLTILSGIWIFMEIRVWCPPALLLSAFQVCFYQKCGANLQSIKFSLLLSSLGSSILKHKNLKIRAFPRKEIEDPR
jgi:hypothetical protein